MVRNYSKNDFETAYAPLFPKEKVTRVIVINKNGKAPWSDLIEVCVLIRSFAVFPSQFVDLYNGCLQWGILPNIWKGGSLRALLKSDNKDTRDLPTDLASPRRSEGSGKAVEAASHRNLLRTWKKIGRTVWVCPGTFNRRSNSRDA